MGQWGSEILPFKIQKHLKSGLFEVRFQMLPFSNGWASGIWMVETWPITEWSGIPIPFEYRTKFTLIFTFEYQTTIWVPNNWIPDKKIPLFSRCFCYSIISIIRMYVIQIPTVIKKVIDFNVYQKAFSKHHNTRLCVDKILYNGHIQIPGMSVAQTCSLLSLWNYKIC